MGTDADAQAPIPRAAGAVEPRAVIAPPGATRTRADGHFGPCVPPPERCDELDNDCDGAIEKTSRAWRPPASWARGPAPPRASGSVRERHRPPVLRHPGPASAERCDGLDDDCDGRADEDAATPCYPGTPPASLGIGVWCAAGALACARAGRGLRGSDPARPRRSATASTTTATAPLTRSRRKHVLFGPLVTRDVGLCAPGRRACEAGVAGPCVDEVLPGSEIRDGADNDCDGETDEDAGDWAGGAISSPAGPATLAPPAPRAPASPGGQPGLRRRPLGPLRGRGRAQGRAVMASTTTEDGRVDADVVGVGEPARWAWGVPGPRHPALPPGGLCCDAEPGAGPREICDGVDDDRDGSTDEGLGLGDALRGGRRRLPRPRERARDGAGGALRGLARGARGRVATASMATAMA
ncbi:MAG: MopE-related protein [bacterium]